MRDRFDRCLDGLLPASGAVILAVSGGIDSMVMADLFLNTRHTVRIALAHCNFHLRGEESDGDAAFVEGWASSRGILFFKTDFDTAGYASSHGISIEMAARELRYSWFASLCDENGYDAVAVAHNANDNAETLILNLLRGTGLKGICGMREESGLQGSASAALIRPMLGFTRDEIREYALSKGLRWREDSTNADSAYKRNLIRNEIFPLFEKVNPSFLDTLLADMRRFDQVREVADDFVDAHLPSIGRTEIDVRKLKSVPHWDYLLYRLLEPYGFNESVIEDIVCLIKDGPTFSGRRFVAKDYEAVTSRDSIHIIPLGVEDGRHAGLLIDGPGEYSLDGVCFVVDMAEVGDLKQPEGITIADIAFPFTVRHWEAGDWMRPLGLGGRRKKLSDMFNDLKFSAFQKEKALVIADEGSHVLALLGYRVDISVALPALRPVGELVEPQGPVIRIRLI